MHNDVHCFIAHESFGSIPQSFVLSGFTPRVLYHIVFVAFLVFGYTVNQHTVVVSSFPVVVCQLALFLCAPLLRLRLAVQFLFFGFHFQPVCHVRTAQFLHLFCIGHYGYTVACEALFAYVTTPCNGVTLIDSVVKHFHQLVDRQVVGRSPTPVVLYFQDERLVEGMVGIGSQ